jgi:hypothetical protein
VLVDLLVLHDSTEKRPLVNESPFGVVPDLALAVHRGALPVLEFDERPAPFATQHDVKHRSVVDRVVEIGVVAEEQREALALGQRRDCGAYRVAEAVPALDGRLGRVGRTRRSSWNRLRAAFTTIRHTQASSVPSPRKERRCRTAWTNAS